MKSAKPLLIQAIITELLSLGFFGSTANLWIVGLSAPIFGLILPFICIADRGSYIASQLMLPAAVLLVLAAIVIFSALGKLNRWFGHIALGLFSLGSTLCLLALE